MESGRDSGSSVDFRTGATTTIGEVEQFNSGKELLGFFSSPSTSELASRDHFMPNATTTTHNQTYLLSELHNTSSVTEKRDGKTINSDLEAHPPNPFGEAHPSPLENNSALSSLSPSSPSSHNPFLLPSDAASTTHVGAGVENGSFSTYPDGSPGEAYHAFSGEKLGMHSSLEQSACESSSGNPFEVQTSDTPLNGEAVSRNVDENHDHRHESHRKPPAVEQGDWSMPSGDAWPHPTNALGETHVSSSSQQQLDPLFTLEESAQNQKLANATDKTRECATAPTKVESHHGMASSNLGTGNVAVLGETSVSNQDKKLGSSESLFSPASKSSTQDPMHNSINAASNSHIGTNAPPKVGMNSKLALESSHDDDIPISSMPKHGQKSSDPGTNSGSQIQNPPVQVMERPGDPAASSNYRIPSHVFSRNRSNTQWSTASNESLFSIQMGNMSFSRDMSWFSKSGELGQPGGGGDMCMPGAFPSNQPPLPPQPQPPANKFSDMSQRAAEQHEGSGVTEEKAAETMREVIMEESLRKGNLSGADGAPHFIRRSNSNDHSNHSNGSTRSFAFKVLTDGDRTPKRVEQKLKQQKQSAQQTTKETPDAAQTTKSTISASQNRWLSCFTCCQ